MKHEGFCPDCKEWTEVTTEENGCCNCGCVSEGDLVTSEDLNKEELSCLI